MGSTSSGEALASISAQRHMEPAKLTKLVRGALDWIVIKCLEKDRNRRYETANGLAMDVQHCLQDESVQACPPSAWYRFRKFARRKKAALMVAMALVLSALSAQAGLERDLGWGTGFTAAGAEVRGAYFSEITLAQLYSTASYQARDLTGIRLGGDMTRGNFAGITLRMQPSAVRVRTFTTRTSRVPTLQVADDNQDESEENHGYHPHITTDTQKRF